MSQPLGMLRLPTTTARTNGFRAADFEVLNGLPQYRPQGAGLAGCRHLVQAAQVSMRRMEPGCHCRLLCAEGRTRVAVLGGLRQGFRA